jgi:hypothetical protein
VGGSDYEAAAERSSGPLTGGNTRTAVAPKILMTAGCCVFEDRGSHFLAGLAIPNIA